MASSSSRSNKTHKQRQRHRSSSWWQEDIETTLRRLDQTNRPAASSLSSLSSIRQRPPDPANAAIGNRLAQLLLEGLISSSSSTTTTTTATTTTTTIRDIADKIVLSLCDNASSNNTMSSPSIVHSFFQTLSTCLCSNSFSFSTQTQQQQQVLVVTVVVLEWMSRWIRQMYDIMERTTASSSNSSRGGCGRLLEILSAMIDAYAKCCCHTIVVLLTSSKQQQRRNDDNNNTDNAIADDNVETTTTRLLSAVQAQSAAIVETYSRCQLSCTRTCLLRQFLSQTQACTAVTTEITTTTSTTTTWSCSVLLLSPLMAASVFNLYSPHEERILFLEGVWRMGWKSIHTRNNRTSIMDYSHKKEEEEDESIIPNSNSIIQFLTWLAKSLHIFLNGIPNYDTQSAVQNSAMEIAYQWMIELADMIAALSSSSSPSVAAAASGIVVVDDDTNLSSQEQMTELLTLMFERLLPHFVVMASTCSCRFAMEPVLVSLCNTLRNDGRRMTMQFDGSTWFTLGTLALLTPLPRDVSCILTLLKLLPHPDDDSAMVQGLLYSLAYMFAQNDECKDSANRLLMSVEPTASVDNVSLDKHRETFKKLTSIFQVPFENSEDNQGLLHFMTTSLTNVDPATVSVLDQTSALLFGCSLLWYKAIDRMVTHSYLRALLQTFPHLGITLLPVLFQFIQIACKNKDGGSLLCQLHFLCDAVVKDPYCAQEVWNLVGVTMVRTDSPTSVRSTAIRTYPNLCASNKRLYRRVIDSLAGLVDSAEPEIRLAVAATLNDLARGDRIRDVTDVIGWVQTYLTDENSSVVHFAVMCLHHLVVAQELDYTLVIKVLNKRLCSIDDAEELLALPGVVLKALVMLLGDGECGDAESEEDEVVAYSSKEQVGVPPQVSASISALILLAKSENTPRTSPEEIVPCTIVSICKSLSSYSLHALGIDDEGVRSATIGQYRKPNSERVAISDTGLRYIELKRVASDALRSPLPNTIAPDSDPTVSLTRKILALEEEALGSSLWEKRGKTTPNTTNRANAPKAAYSPLPSSDQIHQMYLDDPSESTSIASLLSYSGRSAEDLFDFASYISEGLQEPICQVFSLQGWLHAMSMIWAGILDTTDCSKLEAAASVVDTVNGWHDLLDSADSSYLALAAFSLFVPDVLSDPEGDSHADFRETVERIRNELFLAYEGQQFRSRDTSGLSLGIVAARALQSRAGAFVEKSIDVLEQSISEHSAQTSFGAWYGLALIAQIAATVCTETDASLSSDRALHISWINRILSLIVNEIQSCTEETIPSFVTLVASLKSGKLSPDLLSSLSAQDDVVIPESNEQKVSGLLLTLALCVQAVGIVNADLLLCLFKFVTKLPWSAGKGIVLPNAVLQCVSYGVLNRSEIAAFFSEHKLLGEVLLEKGDMKGFIDVLHASISTKTCLPPIAAESVDFDEVVEKIAQNESANMSDDCLSSFLLAATNLVSTFPCLGNGGRVFCSAANLHPQVTKEKVFHVASLLSDISGGSRGAKSAATANQTLGLLASIKVGLSHVAPHSVFEVYSSGNSSGPQKPTRTEVNLERLPSPQEGTLLESILLCIRQEWERMNTEPRTPSYYRLTRLLSCLEALSLPSEFARSFIEPLLSSSHNELKPACVALLTSQVSGRRRAAFDGREYLKLVNRLVLLPPASFDTVMGNRSGSVTLIRSLHLFLPRLPSDNVQAVMLSLWKICEAEVVVSDSALYTVAYLNSLARLLETKQKKGASRLSPRTHTTIVQILLHTALPTLFSSAKETPTTAHAVENSFLDCLSRLECSVLEENGLFVLSGGSEQHDANLSKAFCIAGLVERLYFEDEQRSSKELLKIVAWYVNQRDNTTGDATLGELAFRIAVATRTASSESKKDIVSLLFEALQVKGTEMCFTLLGILASIWSSGLEPNVESSSAGIFLNGASKDSLLPPRQLSTVSKLLLNDTPFNLGAYGRSAKLQGLIANSVSRIYKAWSERGVAQAQLGVLEGILVSCRTLDEAKENDFITLILPLLTAQPYAPAGE